MVEQTPPSLTIGIPTYGRPEYLRRALGYLIVAQEEAGKAGLDPTRVLVLVNGPADGYSAVPQDYDQLSWLEWEFVEESGVSRARNTILASVMTSHVAFLDDDSFVRPDWLVVAHRLIREHPGHAAFGGPFHAFFEAERPAWMPKNFGSNGVGRSSRVVHLVNGGNMIVHRSTAMEVGGFSLGLGPDRGNRRRGDETEFCLRLVSAGHTLWFDSALVIDHVVKPFLLSRRGYLRERFTKGWGEHRIFAEDATSRWDALRGCLGHGLAALKQVRRSSSEAMFHLGKSAKFAGVLLGPSARSHH